MIGWLTSAKVDHPLADSEASRRVIQDLPVDEQKAMGEILFWLDSVNSTEAFKLERRFELLDEVYQATRLRVRKSGEKYMRLRQQKFHENRIWATQTEYWRLSVAGYMRCVEGFQADEPGSNRIKPSLPVIVSRALHAIGQQLKWSLLRYSPIDMVHWADLGRLYAFAELGGFAADVVPLYKGARIGSSPRNAVLQTLMLAVASTDSMQPEQIEIAERSVGLFVPQFLIERKAAPECTHVFNLALSEPPRRVGRAVPADQKSLRFFGAGGACAEMTRLLDTMLAEGSLPNRLDVGAGHEPQAVAEVWRHLLQYWSPSPPERRSARRATNVPLSVVQGFRGLSGKFMEIAEDSLDFTKGAGPEAETWVADNVSAGGYGATAHVRSCEWVRVGALVGLKAQGVTGWSAGIVRRLSRADEQHRRMGIEILAPVVIAVRLMPFEKMAASDAVPDHDFGILMTPRPDADRAIQLMIAAGTFTPGRPLQMSVKDQAFQIAPMKLLQSTDDFDLARFTIVRRIQ
jgi:hypothetical protein